MSIFNKVFSQKSYERKTGIFINNNQNLIELEKLPDSGSINDITKSLGYNENQVHSIFLFDSNILTNVIVKIFTKEVVFAISKVNASNLTMSILNKELENINWEFEYSSSEIESILSDGIENRALTYDYLNSIIHLKPLSDLIYYSTNIDLNLHFDNGILIDFSSSDGFNAASRWLRNLNQSMFDRIVTEAKFNQKLNSAAIDEINAQCDALQSIPNAIDNKFLNKFINSNGNYNFYNLKVVHYEMV